MSVLRATTCRAIAASTDARRSIAKGVDGVLADLAAPEEIDGERPADFGMVVGREGREPDFGGDRVEPMNARDIAFLPAAEQARRLAAGELTSPALVEIYLERISAIDPELRSYRVVLDESARAEAAAAQQRIDSGERLPFLGVPVAIKDDADIAGEITTMGTGAHGPAKTRR